MPSPRCSRTELRLHGWAGVHSRTRRGCRGTASLSCLRSTAAGLSLGATVPYPGRGRLTPTAHHTLAAFVGIAWAEATHDGCRQATGAATREGFQLAHTPAALAAWGTPSGWRVPSTARLDGRRMLGEQRLYRETVAGSPQGDPSQSIWHTWRCMRARGAQLAGSQSNQRLWQGGPERKSQPPLAAESQERESRQDGSMPSAPPRRTTGWRVRGENTYPQQCPCRSKFPTLSEYRTLCSSTQRLFRLTPKLTCCRKLKQGAAEVE